MRVEVGQLSFVLLGLLLEQSFRVLEIRWARWVGGLASGLLHPISGLDPVVAMIAVGACIGFDTVGPP